MFIGKTNHKEKAFTLIEVLVAMVIFSFVMVVSVTSYRMSLMNLTKENKSERVKELTSIKIINNQIRSLIPFIFRLSNGEQVPFFQGKRNQFLFITENPIQVTSPIAIVLIQVVENQLQYCEVEYGAVKLENLIFKSNACKAPFIYLTGEGIELSYFGWENAFELDSYYSEYLNVAVKPQPRWSGDFFSQERKLLPLYIQIKRKDQSAIRLKLPEMTSFEQGATNAFEG